MNKKEIKKKLDEVFDENKGELQEGFNMAASWGIEAYLIDRETGKLKTLTLEEALELKDKPNYELVSIKDYSPEEVMKQYAPKFSKAFSMEYPLTPEEAMPSSSAPEQ